MYIGYEQVAVAGVVLDAAALAIPATATLVELQADTTAVRYTMDGVIAPTGVLGMLLLVTEPPKLFLREDLANIQFFGDGGVAGVLKLHYIA